MTSGVNPAGGPNENLPPWIQPLQGVQQQLIYTLQKAKEDPKEAQNSIQQLMYNLQQNGILPLQSNITPLPTPLQNQDTLLPNNLLNQETLLPTNLQNQETLLPINLQGQVSPLPLPLQQQLQGKLEEAAQLYGQGNIYAGEKALTEATQIIK